MINLQKPVMVSNEAFLKRLDIPTWAINYLKYGKDETEELQPNDLALVKFFRSHWDPLEKKSEEFFSNSPAFGLPSTVETWACLPKILSGFVSYAPLNHRIGINGHVVYYTQKENGTWRIVHTLASVFLDGRKTVGVCVNEVLERIRLAKDEHVKGFVTKSHNTILFKSNKNIA